IDGDRIPVPPTELLDKSKLPKHPYANDNRRGMHAFDFDLERVDLKFLEHSWRFIREHVATSPDEPFFLLHSTQAVHLPSFPAPRFQGQTQSGPHGDFIFELDFIVGALMGIVKELGIDDDTIVIFTSDNGPEVPTVYHMRHDHQHDGARPWRGVKRDNWEGGHRVPLIVRWPGKVAGGTTSNHLVSLCDLYATIAEVVGAEVSRDAAEDSYSLLSIFSEQQKGPLRPYLLQQAFRGKRALAIRQGRWMYLDHQGSGGNRYEGNRFLAEYALPNAAPMANAQLYDLEADPGEKTNVILEHKDVAARLKMLLDQSVRAGRSRP
ncbi:MAG: sulfatase-like hydrolase/transferase, partial [Planctomycetota bacterium]